MNNPFADPYRYKSLQEALAAATRPQQIGHWTQGVAQMLRAYGARKGLDNYQKEIETANQDADQTFGYILNDQYGGDQYPQAPGTPGINPNAPDARESRYEQLIHAVANNKNFAKKYGDKVYSAMADKMFAEPKYMGKLYEGDGGQMYSVQTNADGGLQAVPVRGLAAPSKPKDTDDIREYRLAKEEGYEGSFRQYMLEQRRAGATKVEQNSSYGPGIKKLDQQFSETVVIPYVLKGGFADELAQLDKLETAMGMLQDPNSTLTGPVVGLTPDTILSFTNPDAIDAREQVEEVVQRNLREVLGTQFTENEGERLIKRAYNPKLSEEKNINRLRRLIRQIKLAAMSKRDSVEYFRNNNESLQGYDYRPFTLNDMSDAISENPEINQRRLSEKLDSRGEELERELISQQPGLAGTPELERMVSEMLKKEFGL